MLRQDSNSEDESLHLDPAVSGNDMLYPCQIRHGERVICRLPLYRRFTCCQLIGQRPPQIWGTLDVGQTDGIFTIRIQGVKSRLYGAGRWLERSCEDHDGHVMPS